MAVISPQIRLALDTLLVKVCNDEWASICGVKKNTSDSFGQCDAELRRIKSWAEELVEGEKPLRRELLIARREIEEKTEASFRPSRELDDYALHTVAYLGSGPAKQKDGSKIQSSKQGWLFLRTITGKPARTHWVRRWFFVKNGIFGCLIHSARTGGVEESEKIGVLLCGVRPAFQEERRFCFEVKTKDSTILLQAETQSYLTEWIQAFEAAKKKAIDDPEASDMLASSNNPSADAAFAVSPAIAPELAAKGADGQFTTITEDPQAQLLSTDADVTPNMQARSSFDVNASRRLEGDIQVERTRDHAARILEKLDIHRKSTAGSQLTGGVHSPTGSVGMSSLLGAIDAGVSSSPNPNAAQIFYSPSLAPATLANPPVQTHLSKVALKIAVERGVDLGAVDSDGGVPSGLMANQWGCAQYGYVSRLERGEVGRKPASQSPSPARRNSDPTDAVDHGPAGETGELLETASSIAALQSHQNIAPTHRKTTSIESSQISRSNTAFTEYPNFYPAALKAHDAQFRMLFPNVPHHERLVLVFRASWNPDSGHSLPGRVFVTQGGIFFYSHHMGMVVVHGASLGQVAEVTFESDEGHDYMYMHMKEGGSRGEEEDIMLKIFLDSPVLLQQRLEYLIQSNDSEEPDNLETALQNLVKIETSLKSEEQQRQADETTGARKQSRRANAAPRTRLRVDRGLGGAAVGGVDGSDVARFKLPSKPVSYTPLDVTAKVAENIYDLSAKALLHVVFGDKSAVCPTIYQQRGSDAITQHPWVRVDEKGPLKRQFDYQIRYAGTMARQQLVSVVDVQSIDVASDHLCYMITESKVPWHLPRARDFTLITKVVITHEAKSRSKISIYVKVNWLRQPWFGKSIIDRQAVDDMEMDALNMMDIVTEQVDRLGPACSTRRVMEIYGGIGIQTDAAQVKGPTNVGRPLRVAVGKKTIPGLLLESARSITASTVSSLMMLIFGALRFIAKTVTTHGVLAALLSISVAFSFYTVTERANEWWSDRQAATFMAHLGVVPNMSMSRSIYISDITDAVSVPSLPEEQYRGQCSKAFQSILNETYVDKPAVFTPVARQNSSSSSSQITSRRLHRTRQRLGSYRHDIMVALRLINRVEREAVRAEYESWLLSESQICSQVSGMLSRSKASKAQNDVDGAASSDNSTAGSVPELSQDRTDRLARWLTDYCESCRLERESLRLAGLD